MRILVTGGAGYIGSHAVRELLRAGHTVTVLDDLSTGHRAAVDAGAHFTEGHTSDHALVLKTLRERDIEAVLHFAASSDVAESVANPEKYHRNNYEASLSLLRSMDEAGVRKIVFSSTASVYGNATQMPILEDAPRRPINPYGESKAKTEDAIREAARTQGLGFAILRYFNVAGANPDGTIGEAHEPETHLIPRVLGAARDGKPVNINGIDYQTPDGTCVRDYVHVVDLVDAHILALKKIEPGRGAIYNIGSESGYSVRQVIEACKVATGIDFRVEIHPRRPGDPDRLIASSEQIRTLGWRPRYNDIATIIAHAWNWHRTHPHGYRSPAPRA